MPAYAWEFLNKQDSEYAYSKYAKSLNLAKFWIWQGSQYAICFTAFQIVRIFLAWQSSKYIKVTQGATMWLNVSVLDVNIPEDVWISNNKQAFEYVTLQVNEYLLRDIQDWSKI